MTILSASLIQKSCRTHHALRAALIAAFPDLDDRTLKDTLEGLSDFEPMLGALIRSALEDQVLVEALSQRLAHMRDRRDRLTRRLEKKRALALQSMLSAQMTALQQPDFSAFVRSGPATIEVVASAEIPEGYWKPQPAILDKTGLARALRGGASVPGARLLPATPHLSVRTQ